MVLEINEELKTGIIERLIPEEKMRTVRTFDPEISSQASYYKNSEKGETDMCDIIEEYAEKREARGEANAMRGVVGKFLKSGKDVAYIAEFLELPLAEVEKYVAELDAL